MPVQPVLHSMCSIHNDKMVSGEFMSLSGGWGGRGQGLGLLACVTGTVEGEAQVGRSMVCCNVAAVRSADVLFCFFLRDHRSWGTVRFEMPWRNQTESTLASFFFFVFLLPTRV